MVPFLINTEIFLILFQVFSFISLHVGRIAEEICPFFLKWDNLFLQSKKF